MSLVFEFRNHELLVLQGKKKRGSLKISKAFRIPYELELFQNEGMEIEQGMIERVVDALKSHAIKERKVDVIINNQTILTRDFMVPKVEPKKLQVVVRSEMTALFNLSPEYIIDYRILEEEQKDGVTTLHVIASAALTKLIENIESFMKACRLQLISIDSAPSALLRTLDAANTIVDSLPTLVLEVTEEYVRYYVYHDFSFLMLRTNKISDFNDHKEIVERIMHLTEIMSKSLIGRYGTSIQKVIIIAYEDIVEEVLDAFASYPKFTCELINLNSILYPNEHEDIQVYSSGLGSLI